MGIENQLDRYLTRKLNAVISFWESPELSPIARKFWLIIVILISAGCEFIISYAIVELVFRYDIPFYFVWVYAILLGLMLYSALFLADMRIKPLFIGIVAGVAAASIIIPSFFLILEAERYVFRSVFGVIVYCYFFYVIYPATVISASVQALHSRKETLRWKILIGDAIGFTWGAMAVSFQLLIFPISLNTYIFAYDQGISHEYFVVLPNLWMICAFFCLFLITLACLFMQSIPEYFLEQANIIGVLFKLICFAVGWVLTVLMITGTVFLLVWLENLILSLIIAMVTIILAGFGIILIAPFMKDSFCAVVLAEEQEALLIRSV